MRIRATLLSVYVLYLLMLTQCCLGFADDLIRANMHIHDQPICAVDPAGIVDHVRASWGPQIYRGCKSIKLTGVVMCPHGISMVNGHTALSCADTIDGHLNPYPGLLRSALSGSFKPAHWHNEMTWAQQASTDGFVGLRAFEWSGDRHINVIGSANWTDMYDFKSNGKKSPAFADLSAEPYEATGNFPALCDWLTKNRISIYGGDVVCQFNHVDNGMTGWRNADFERLRENDASQVWPMFSLMQLLSGPGFEIAVASGIPNISRPELVYFQALKAGWQVGPTIGEDNLTDPPDKSREKHTGVWVKSKTQKGFMDALRRHRVYATTCASMKFDFKARVGQNQCLMGEQIQAKVGDRISFDFEVNAESKIGRISLMEVSMGADAPRTLKYSDEAKWIKDRWVGDGTFDNGGRGYEISASTVCYYFKIERGLKTDYTWSAPVFIYHPVTVSQAPRPAPKPGAAQSKPTKTVFVMDCSGSMGTNTPDGVTKLDAARNAANHYLDLIDFDSKELGAEHQVGLVAFASSVLPVQELTPDIDLVKQKLSQLSPMDSTDFGDAIDQSLSWFEQTAGQVDKDRRVLIFLSDGMTNTGPVSRDEFVVDAPDDFANQLRLYQRIRDGKIAAYTIGFGDPSVASVFGGDAGLDEQVLRKIAGVPGTGGEYYQASDAFRLDEVYISRFHEATGDIVFEETGTIKMNAKKVLGPITPGTRASVVASGGVMGFFVSPAYADGKSNNQMLLTLSWSTGKLGLVVKDPAGRVVDESYPGAHLRRDTQPMCIAIDSPMAGNWTATVSGDDIPSGEARYYFAASARVPSGGGGGGGGADDGLPAMAGLLIMLAFMVLLSVCVLTVKTKARDARARNRLRNVVAPAIGPSAEIVVVSTGRRTIVTCKPFSIGRSSSCALVLDAQTVSRTHAEIRYSGGNFVVDDLGSKHGITVNGRQCTRSILMNGDRIGVGGVELLFLQG